jgi:hypothetical protein
MIRRRETSLYQTARKDSFASSGHPLRSPPIQELGDIARRLLKYINEVNKDSPQTQED